MKNKHVLYSLGHAALVFLYTTLITWVLSHGKEVFGPEEPKSLWVPTTMLMLFVLSAAITGALVLGRPIMLYLNGQKAEAVKFFGYTVGWLCILVIILLILQPWR